MVDERRVLARVAASRTTEEWVASAEKYGLLREGQVDLAGRRVQFNHRDLDLTRFRLQGADLSGSILTDPQGAGVSFEGCVLKKVRVVVGPGRQGSLRGARFDRSRISDAEFGPRTLDFTGASFCDAEILRSTFRMGQLEGARFDNATLVDVMLRGAQLEGSSFRGAVLERTSLERAELTRADFTNARFIDMSKWGEPDFTGAVIDDGLRYRFGVVRDPIVRLSAVRDSEEWSADERRSIDVMIERVRSFAANAPEAMLIEEEYADVVPGPLFRRLLKAAKWTN